MLRAIAAVMLGNVTGPQMPDVMPNRLICVRLRHD
jgi:hypothetical protein